ncbi:AAA family ATPase [Candidatus Saccharibacteria bacterium]|nr:AAA family ATPase [Candidatus Saccharibacteria bacterium]
MRIIGIGGLSRSGKDTLAEFLIEKGYYGVSLGDIVRNASRQRHANEPDPISVANMTETANSLRHAKGADFALKEAVGKFEAAGGEAKYKGLLVFSVRAPAEADFILSHGGQLIWLVANDQVRYQRAMSALRKGEAQISFDEFQRQEGLQWNPQPGIPSQAQMNAEYVKAHSTATLDNSDNNLEKFKQAAQKALKL